MPSTRSPTVWVEWKWEKGRRLTSRPHPRPLDSLDRIPAASAGAAAASVSGKQTTHIVVDSCPFHLITLGRKQNNKAILEIIEFSIRTMESCKTMWNFFTFFHGTTANFNVFYGDILNKKLKKCCSVRFKVWLGSKAIPQALNIPLSTSRKKKNRKRIAQFHPTQS